MPTYNPAAPWNGPYPVTVIDEDTGMEWEAYGPNQLKKPTVVINSPEDCCLYTTEVSDTLNPDVAPEAPSFAPLGKSDGDTFLVQYANGYAMFECLAGAWEYQYHRCIGEPHTDAEFEAANTANHDVEEGMPVGKNAAGKLVAQPPLICKQYRSAIDQTLNFTASLDDIVAAGGGPSLGAAAAPIDLAEVCFTLENDTCWPMVYDLTSRVNYDMDMAPGNRWRILLFSKQSVHWVATAPWGSEEVSPEVSGAGPASFETAGGFLINTGKATLQPGESLELCVCVQFQARYYVPDPQNRLVVYAPRMFACGQNCHIAEPTDQTTSTSTINFI